MQSVDKELSRPEPQTWAHNVLIPLSQNIVGGAAVGGLGLIGFIATQSWRNVVWFVDDAALWCFLVGGAVASIATVVRFFGDDLGLMAASYRAGYNAREAEVSALHIEINALRNDKDVERAEGGAGAAISKRQLQDARQMKSAIKLIEVYFAGGNVSRGAMDKGLGMGRADWDAGVRLLKAAGVVDGNNIFVATNAGVALRAIKEIMERDRSKGDKFVPKWQ